MYSLISSRRGLDKFTGFFRRSGNFSTSQRFNYPRQTSQYEQIPEHLKIHMFVNELRIVKEDELCGPFAKFSPQYIVNLLDSRANEVRLEKDNSNPASRMTSANITRIMKLNSRLKQLFDINGGNTEILDAVLSSQSSLEKLESKLAAKKPTSSSSLDTKEPGKPQYLQIPDDIKIYEFVDLLEDIKSDIGTSFASVTAQEVMVAVDKRIKKYKAIPGALEDTLSRYYTLSSRLKRLLDMNGSYTFVLDTVINSQKVFNKFEAQIESKRATRIAASEYKQLPDNFALEEFSEELQILRTKLGYDFSSAKSSDILEANRNLIESEDSYEKKSAFQRLLRNLEVLFRHNNNETFILDNVLSSLSTFRAFEHKMESERYETLLEDKSDAVKYRDAGQISELLGNTSSPMGDDFLETDAKIKTVVLSAMSKEEKELSNLDPEEYELLKSLTPEKIRAAYARSHDGSEAPKKDEVEIFLKESKKNKDLFEERMWREREAYEWSSNAYFKQRSLEAKNFFNPIAAESSYSFPMFPSRDQNSEYLILSTDGQQLKATQNPLGLSHVPENVLTIFEKVPESALPTVIEAVSRLKKKGWQLVGSGKNGSILVLTRNKRRRFAILLSFLKAALLVIGFVVGLSVVDAWRSIKEDHKRQIQALDDVSEERHSQVKKDEQIPFWRKLLWS